MEIAQQDNLKHWTTFGVSAYAQRIVSIQQAEDLVQGLKEIKDLPFYILGGGSNVLFTQDWPGWVFKNDIRGKQIVQDNGQEVLVEVGGGENWHNFVLWALDQGLAGVENLSLIPGTVGAAPIQNIGAYGVELKDVFDHLEAIRLSDGALVAFDAAACQFGYRNSVFKQELKGHYFITKVFLRLNRGQSVNITYGAITSTLEANGIQHPTPKAVSDAVIQIRSSKLPDPAALGNAGSFFKNPEIERAPLEQLKVKYPNIVFYPLASGKVKVPAGWLIEQCGWKGKQVGNTGCYAKQALVIVNYGDATGQEIWEHAMRVKASVAEAFGIDLEPEVNVIPVPNS